MIQLLATQLWLILGITMPGMYEDVTAIANRNGLNDRTSTTSSQSAALELSKAGLPDVQFQAPDLKAANDHRRAFETAVRDLDTALLKAGKPYREAWLTYLHGSPVVESVLAGQQPELADVSLLRRWLFSNQKGVDASIFQPIREAILPYERSRFAAELPNLEAMHHAHLIDLSHAFGDYQNSPTLANRSRLQKELYWFELTQSDGGALQEFFAAYRRPNFAFHVPESVIRNLVPEDFHDYRDQRQVSTSFDLPLRPNGKSTPMSAAGTATTAGRVDFELVPSPETIRLAIRFDGRTEAQTNSNVNRLKVSTQMASQVAANGFVDIAPEGVYVSQIQGTAKLQHVGFGFQSSHRSQAVGGVVRNFADRVVDSSRVQSSLRQQVVQHFEEEIKAQFRKEVEKAAEWRDAMDVQAVLARQNEQLAEVTAPLSREGVEIKLTQLASQPDAIQGGFQLTSRAAITTTATPQFTSKDSIQVCLHESFVNNFFTQVWGGKWIADDYIENASRLIYAEAPYELYTHDRKERWEVRLAAVLPFNFELNGKDHVKVTFRIDAFRYLPPNESEWRLVERPMDFVAVYQIHVSPFDEIELQRTSFEAIAADPKTRFTYLEYTQEKSIKREADEAEFLARQEQRMQAWLGESIDFGGIVVPDGGELSQQLQRFALERWTIRDGWFQAEIVDRSKTAEAASHLQSVSLESTDN